MTSLQFTQAQGLGYTRGMYKVPLSIQTYDSVIKVHGLGAYDLPMAFQSRQNCQQFSWSKPVPISWSNTYLYGQNSHFCCQNMFRPTNFLDHEISWSQNFLVNLHSIPILCSIPFHSNSISWSVTNSWSVTVHPNQPRLPTYLNSDNSRSYIVGEVL